MHKRGISGVIVALILVLLALVAVGILWFVVRNIVTEGSEGISLRRLFVDLKIKKVVIGEDNITIRIEKTGKEDISGINFIISDGENSETIKNETDIQELEERTFILVPEKISIDSIEKISVAPIFKLESGEEESGNIVDSYLVKTNGGTNGDDGSGEVGGICINGETQLCPFQSGVCYGSEQTCTGETWPGCDYSGISGYESTETTCNDGLDNDCDGNVDTADTDCAEECTPDCAGKVCGDDGCGGTCPPGCDPGYICNPAGTGCEIETSLNYGTILSIWPSNAAKYFDSDDLPKDNALITSYIGKYINFSSETRCMRIYFAEYLSELGYDKSYLRLESVAAINSGDNYEIWETEEGCNL